MSKTRGLSRQTRQNWLLDAAVFLGGVLAGLTGLYFLYWPRGGYEGGRNPAYGVVILFARESWHDIHTWGGLLMILAVVLHLGIHWGWVQMMSRRVVRAARGEGGSFSRGAKVNLGVDAVIGLAFLVTAVSAIYLLFVSGAHQGGRSTGWFESVLFSVGTWDLIHTWAGVTMMAAAALHFFIHWGWISKVTRRFFQLPGRSKRVEAVEQDSFKAGAGAI